MDDYYYYLANGIPIPLVSGADQNNDSNAGYVQTVPQPFPNVQYIQSYQQLAAEYTKLIDSKMELDINYKVALQEIENLKAGLGGDDYELAEDTSDRKIYLLKGNRRVLFAEISISKVQMIWVCQPAGQRLQGFLLWAIRRDGQNVCIALNEKTLDSPKLLIDSFEKAGIAIMVAKSDIKKQKLLRRLILSKCGNGDIVIFPYLAGWQGKIFYHINQEGVEMLRQLGFDAPVIRKQFSELPMETEKIKNLLSQTGEIFGENGAMLLLSITVASLLYTPLKEAGCCMGNLFILDGRKKNAKSARRLLQIWKDEVQIPLSKGKHLPESLCLSKDETIFLRDDNTEYSFKIGENLCRMLRDREVWNPANNTMEEIKAVPILLTERAAAWKELYELGIVLPISEPISAGEINKETISSFYRVFCNWLNANGSLIPETISFWKQQKGQTVANSESDKIYHWIMAAHDILSQFLQMQGLAASVEVSYFSDFVKDWLKQEREMQDWSPGEVFFKTLLNFKKQEKLLFVKAEQMQPDVDDTKLVIYVDKEFTYVSPKIFGYIVENMLSGYTYAEVYKDLVEIGYAATGEKGHVFPKVALGGERTRVAKLQRKLLLSNAEFLTEVE